MSENENLDSVRSPKDYYDVIYHKRLPAQHEWVAGTATPELVNMVWEGSIKSGDNVLEIGSGVGTEAVFLAIRGMIVTGIDLSDAAVALGKRLAEFYGLNNVNFRQMDALNLQFDEGAFDVVCDHGVFHHLRDEDRKQYAEQVNRVLKRGGTFVLRGFSDKMKYDKPQPRLLTSFDLTTTFLPYFDVDRMERVLTFSTETREKPLAWFTVWIKR